MAGAKNADPITDTPDVAELETASEDTPVGAGSSLGFSLDPDYQKQQNRRDALYSAQNALHGTGARPEEFIAFAVKVERWLNSPLDAATEE